MRQRFATLLRLGILITALLPVDLYASAFSRPVLSYPCAGHQCGCATRKQCLLNCCCFPKKTTLHHEAGPTWASCGGMDPSVKPDTRREMQLVAKPLVGGRVREFDINDSYPLYVFLDFDILSPPPKRLHLVPLFTFRSSAFL